MASLVSPSLIERFYRSLYLIRRVEEEIAAIYPTDKIKSPVHLSIGQEASSVGVVEALRPGDAAFGTYRGHALYLAKGGNLKKMIAELYGKVTGCARGKGGSMHLIDTEAKIMGTSAIVATTIPLAVGYALSLRYRQSDSIAVSFFGDGAVDEGAFHESLNFAAVKRLPVLFVCENNSYAIHSHHLTRHLKDNIVERAMSYGMPALKIPDQDIFKIYAAADRYANDIRRGEGPAFLELLSCRWKEHVGPGDDFHLNYRTREEVDGWKAGDQLERLSRLIPPAAARRIESEAEKEIEEAFEFAENSPFPDEDELLTDLFKD